MMIRIKWMMKQLCILKLWNNNGKKGVDEYIVGHKWKKNASLFYKKTIALRDILEKAAAAGGDI